jgi:H+/gluconate symporter-like permease
MLPGIGLGALATASCSMPGTTSDQNIIASQFLHTSAMTAPIPGFIGGAFVLSLNIIVMNLLARREIARGHLYTPQQREQKMTEDTPKPHWLISIIPMASTIIGYNAFNMKQTFAQMGISMNALHRVAVFSSQTLDTLPTNPGYIISTEIAEVSINEPYKYVFISTLLNTAITAVLAATRLTNFPGWA